MVKEGITMDFAVHDHADERTTAAITSLVEILGHISNALGTGIDFTEAPITKKPTSKKIDIDGDMHTDNTSLGNKSIILNSLDANLWNDGVADLGKNKDIVLNKIWELARGGDKDMIKLLVQVGGLE